MIDLPRFLVFIRKAKKTQVASTHQIDRVLPDPDIIKYWTIGEGVREFVCPEGQRDSVGDAEPEPDFISSQHIAVMAEKEPFLSLRQIAKKILSSK
jgi:hypothetical protein